MNELKLLGVTLLIAILQSTALICQPNFTIGSASGDQNDVVTIELRVSNFTDLVGLEFALEWDASVAEFVSFDNVNSAITGFASAAPPAIADGEIKFIWSAGASVTLEADDIFYSVDLRLVGDPGSSTNVSIIGVTGEPFAIPASDPTTILDINFTAGIVSILGEGGSDPTLTMGSRNVQPGDEFCLGVTVRDFNAVMALQFDMNWNSDVLEFASIDNLNLPDLGPEDFNISGAPSGEVRMAWVTGVAGGGNTLANGTSIFEICFRAIGASGTSSNVEFSNLISVPNFTTVDGTVDIQGGDVTGFALIASDGSGSPGQQICSDISVNGFTDILAIQFSMGWNPTQFSFANITNNNSTLGQNLVIGDPTGDNVDPGTLNVAWFSNAGATLTDGDILFTLCLDAPSDCDASVPVNFTDTPVDIVIVARINGQGEPLPDDEVTLVNSTIAVDCAVNVVLDDLNDPTCNGEETGSIFVSVLPVDGDYSFTWNGQSSTSEDLEDIGAGTYTLNVTDNATGTMMSFEYTLSDPSAIVIDGTSQDPSNAGNDGSITINGVSGGTGVLTCLWDPNISADCSGADGLSTETYNLTVVDENDCMVSETFQLTGSGSTLAIMSNTSSATCATVDNCDGSISVDIETGQGSFVMTIDGQVFEDTATNLCPGDYQIEVMDQGLNQTVTETVTVGGPDVIQSFVSITPVSDISAMDGQAIVTNITGGSGVYDIIWQSTDSDTLSNVGIGFHLLTIRDSDGCEVQKMVPITDVPPVPCFIGASLITPNGDGKNDEFIISCAESRANEFRIFNRWGQLVHQQTNYDNTWDGTDISGNKLLDDVYFWVLSVQIDDGTRRDIQGYFSLIRNLN